MLRTHDYPMPQPPIEVFCWDPALDDEAAAQRRQLERLLEELDEFDF